MNHEFLADEAVVNNIGEVPAYQNLLLDKASNSDQIRLASNLNFGVTKKRLMMMTKPISKRRNVIYTLMVMPLMLFLVSCFGDYREIEVNSDSLIQRQGDIIAVDFTKMGVEQLESVKNELEEFNINVDYEELEFGPNGIPSKFKVNADFNNGNRGSASYDCGELKTQNGIWMNLNDGSTGFGWPESFFRRANKKDIILQMTVDASEGASYHIGDRRVDLNEAVNWLEKTEMWQYTRKQTNDNNWDYTLVSSVDYNPFN